MASLNLRPASACGPDLPPSVTQALVDRRVAVISAAGESEEERNRRLETSLMALFRDQRLEAAYEALYLRTRSMLLAWIVHLLGKGGPGADPVELLQDTYVNVYRYAGGFRDEGKNSFRGWARTIAANVVRRSRRRRGLSLDAMPEGGLEVADGGCGPDQTALVAEQRDELKRAWLVLLLHYAAAYDKLSPRDKRALHLVEVDGLTYVEAGERLGVGRSNMKMIMFRSRKRIRAHILAAMALGTGSERSSESWARTA